MRRSFRFCVAACVAFTITLWIAEKYARYDLTESQYIMSLTLPTESARAVLRNVVKRDAVEHETGTSKYLMALAEREEQDQILPMYQSAYALDPNNASLAIEYGCSLFQAEKYAEARERFREAALQSPKNALPRYLEAAAVTFGGTENRNPLLSGATLPSGALSESLALVAKTNTRNDAVLFPTPLWSPYLPTGGAWYEKLRRQVVDACCAPLYRYKDLVVGKAQKAIASRQEEYWDSWLETLQVMGERIAATGEPRAVQLIAGINIQLAALEQRIAIAHEDNVASESRLIERQTQLKKGLASVVDFENKREERIAVMERRCQLPLSLGWRSVAALIGLLVVVTGLSRLLRPNFDCWALPHSLWARYALALGNSALLLLLLLSMVWQQRSNPMQVHLSATYKVIFATWWAILSMLVVAGLAYAIVQARSFAHRPSLGHLSWPLQMGIGLTFFRRYTGLLLGLLLCTLCVWIISFRIFTHLYPWETQLLATGLANQEIQMAKNVLALIGQ